MNYSARANFVNILFIALIFVAAIGYCICDTTIPPAIGRTVIVLSLLLGAFVIADWYHMYHSNFFGGAFGAIGLGAGIVALALVIGMVLSSTPIFELALLERVEGWENFGWLLRVYIVGTGMAAAAIVGVVGFLLMTALGEFNLPAEECL